MDRPSGLTPGDYRRLLQIMTGPHGHPPTPESPADLLVVFSCSDPEVGRTAARLHRERLVQRIVFSGGAGKDSGGLTGLGITESVFLASVAMAEGLPADVILLEQEARNGAENAAYALRLAAKLGILRPTVRVAGLAPATRSRRLYEELRYQADSGMVGIDVVAGLPSGSADASDPKVQNELIRELRGLSTMDQGDPPRIHAQREFQEGGQYWDLARQASLRD